MLKMMVSAKLKTDSRDPTSISGALDVDNVCLEGLRVKTLAVDNIVVTEIDARNIKTLINTLDDIICCQMLAEKIIG